MKNNRKFFGQTRRSFLKSSSIALGGASLGLGLSCGPAFAKTSLRLGSFFVAIDYAPYLIAKAEGAFNNIVGSGEVEYTMFQSLPPINESFGTGRIDAVFEAEPPALIGAAAGIDVKIVGISCTLIQEILVPVNSNTQSASDLNGAKIAVLAGTSSHYGVLKILEAEGLSASDVEIIDMIPPDAKSAFKTGQVDAWAVWPPFVEQEEIDGSGRVLPRGDAVIHSIMAVSGKLVEEEPDTVKALVAVIEETKAWMQTNPEKAIQIVASELEIDTAVVERAWPRHDWSATLNDSVFADIQAKADFLYEGDYVGTKVKVTDIIDTSFM